jgi:hypothetical protein
MNVSSDCCVYRSRVTRTERDARAYETRLKQHEIELAELKARSDAMTFDIARRQDDNDVRTMLAFNRLIIC